MLHVRTPILSAWKLFLFYRTAPFSRATCSPISSDEAAPPPIRHPPCPPPRRLNRRNVDLLHPHHRSKRPPTRSAIRNRDRLRTNGASQQTSPAASPATRWN